MSEKEKESKDKLPYIANAVLGVVGAALIAWGAWGAHHGRTIAGFVLTSSTIGTTIILALKPKGKIFLLLVLYAVLGIGGYSTWLIWGPAYPPETEDAGWIRAGNEPDDPINCDDANNPLVASIILGTSAVTVPLHQPLTDVILDRDTRVIAFERRNNLIALDADLFDANGYLVAHVDKNKFKLINGKYSYAERHEKNDLIVWGPKKERMLHVWYLNPRTILVSGDFYTKYGNHVIINEGKDMQVIPKSGIRIASGANCGFAIKLYEGGLMIGGPQMLHGPNASPTPGH